MAFDYQSDIAPLRQQFFPMLQGGQNFKANLNYHQSVVMPMQEQTMKLQGNMLRMQQQEMMFERQKLELDTARRRARMEIETMERMPELNKRLSEMFGDPAKSSADLADSVAALTMEMAPAAAYSPAIQSVLNSANNRVKASEQREYKQTILEDRDDRRRHGVMSSAMQIGDTNTVKRLAESDGVIDEFEQAYIDTAGSYKARTEEKQQLYADKEAYERAEKLRKEKLDEFSSYQSTLKSLRTLEGEDLPMTIGADGAAHYDPAAAATKLQFTPKSFSLLKEMAVGLGADPYALKDFSHEELYEATLQKLNSEAKKYRPQVQAPSAILKGFDQ